MSGDFAWGTRTYVMGIVNVTPDSFSGDGILDTESAIAHGLDLAANGADILDVGGESTRPGAAAVDPAEERRRVVPVIQGLRARTSLLISVDTYRAEVARAACEAGAAMVNDVWGFRGDREMAHVVAERGVWAVAMHNRSAQAETAGDVGGFFPRVEYDDLLADIADGLRESVDVLMRAGVSRDRIVVDP
ncbi:MAG: dihydropteroate synthase, partial [Chloroflexi bacterium]|nr:dihydropteroate synthase [Chloroflexota bacterium]